WDMLADAATRFQAALLAPSDDTGSGLIPQTAHQDAGAVIAAAHTVIAGLAPVADPLTALAQLHHAASRHALFAPAERTSVPIAMGPVATKAIRLTVERMGPPSPRWTLELLWGDHWRKTGLLAHALPFPGLVRLDALRAAPRTAEPWDADTADDPPALLAIALRDVAQGLGTSLAETDRLARRLASCQPGKRRSSRAPALLDVLAGFGPLRSSQLEGLLGVTRLGLRTMLDAVSTAGLLDRTTLAGVHLYAINLDARARDHGDDVCDLSTFSAATLDEYDAAMADIDALLARSGVTVEEDADTGEP
ncbi:MAG: hypothetical protein NTX28_04590, partial [Novosphingobium sp.]|nr:hypothetical protein [Novosphingobium sp.]